MSAPSGNISPAVSSHRAARLAAAVRAFAAHGALPDDEAMARPRSAAGARMTSPGAKYLSCDARTMRSRSPSLIAANGACGFNAWRRPASTVRAGVGDWGKARCSVRMRRLARACRMRSTRPAQRRIRQPACRHSTASAVLDSARSRDPSSGVAANRDVRFPLRPHGAVAARRPLCDEGRAAARASSASTRSSAPACESRSRG